MCIRDSDGAVVGDGGGGGEAALAALQRDVLRTAGDPAAGGYGFAELAALSLSAVPQQRALALAALRRFLERRPAPTSSSSSRSEVEEGRRLAAARRYALRAAKLPRVLRRAFEDERHAGVFAAAAAAVLALAEAPSPGFGAFLDRLEAATLAPRGVRGLAALRHRELPQYKDPLVSVAMRLATGEVQIDETLLRRYVWEERMTTEGCEWLTDAAQRARPVPSAPPSSSDATGLRPHPRPRRASSEQDGGSML